MRTKWVYALAFENNAPNYYAVCAGRVFGGDLIAKVYRYEEDAQLIVKCVNAHDDLLAVVNGYAAQVQRVIDAWSGGDLAGAVNLLEDYRDNEAADALAKAGAT